MNGRQPKETEPLRRWLQEGDPAAGELPLGSIDVTRIRNRILAEKTEPALRKFGIWAFAGTMAAAALVLSLVLWPRQIPQPGPHPVVTPPPPVGQGTERPIAAVTTPAVPVVHKAVVQPPSAPAPTPPLAPQAVEARTLLFQGPQGTQIVWIVKDNI